MKKINRGLLTLVAVVAAMLLGAMVGPSWLATGGVQFEPQDKPPVTCDANNVGFFYFQRDAVNFTPANQVAAAPCVCMQCNGNMFCQGTEGYTASGYLWNNTSGQLCKNLWTPEGA